MGASSVGQCVHLIAYKLFDPSDLLGSLGGHDAPLSLPHGRGDEFARGSGRPDPREGRPQGMAARDIFIPDLHIDRLKQKSRDFR